MALRDSRRPERTCRIIAALAAVVVLSQPAAQAQGGSPPALSEVWLPGGLAGAREALDERGDLDRATFLGDLIQRFFNTPAETRVNSNPQLHALVARLQHSIGATPAAGPKADADDVLPLPLTPAWWSDVVFHRQIAPDALVLTILQSRDAALLYWALLSLDAPTRTWLAGRPELVERLLRDSAAVLVVAAPGVRVADGVMQLPGGASARSAWEAVVGAKATEPDVFLRKLVQADRGQQAYLLSALSQLSDAQLHSVLHLSAADPAERVDALRRLYRVFIRATWRWHIPARPFWRPPLDPLLLLSELPATDGAGAFPGSERFWDAVFNNRTGPSNEPPSRDGGVASVDLVWLLEQVYGVEDECRVRTEQVLFASRVFAPLTSGPSADAIVALAALRTHPALVRTLERLQIRDAAVYRRAVERARVLDAIGDADARLRALTQFQGSLALVARAAFTGSLTPQEVPGLVSSLSEVQTSDAGAYDGRLAGWIEDRLRSRVRGAASRPATPEPGAPSAEPGAPARGASRADGQDSSVDEDLQQLLAGPVPPRSRSAGIEWEGTTYRLDLAAAEAVRLERARGERPAPALAAAWALLALANRIAQGSPTSDDLAHHADALDRIARDMAWTDESRHDRDRFTQYRQIAQELRQAAGSRGTQATGRIVALVRRLADDLTARGLIELAYAAALGGPDAGPISAADAALRHDFGKKRDEIRPMAWRVPVKAAAEPGRPGGLWHVEGSLLGLDVCLAERWLRRISSRPLPAPPSIDDQDRRALVEVVAIMEPSSLTDAARDAIAAAIRAGRARLAAAASAADFDAIADAIPLGPARRTLLPWVAAHDRDRLASFLSPAELFGLGLNASDPGRTFDAWGAPAGPRLGCQCLAFPNHRSRDRFMGHWGSGILMGALPDLNLRLAELLAELKMPAPLLPSVLAAATLDVVNHASVRHPDDLRGLMEQVQGLTLDQVEQYLALLTTGGPLVPAEPDVARDAPRDRR